MISFHGPDQARDPGETVQLPGSVTTQMTVTEMQRGMSIRHPCPHRSRQDSGEARLAPAPSPHASPRTDCCLPSSPLVWVDAPPTGDKSACIRGCQGSILSRNCGYPWVWPPGTTHSEGFFICPQEFAEALWAEHRPLQPAARVMSKHSLWRVSLCWAQMAHKTKLALDLGGLTMNIPATGLAAAPYPNATRREGT